MPNGFLHEFDELVFIFEGLAREEQLMSQIVLFETKNPALERSKSAGIPKDSRKRPPARADKFTLLLLIAARKAHCRAYKRFFQWCGNQTTS